MAIPTITEIRAAFTSPLISWAGTKPIKVATENAKFEPPAETYIRCFLIPSRLRNTTTCYGSGIQSGVFQIDIVGKLNEGTANVEALAEQISSIYPEGTRLGGIRITSPVGRSAGLSEKERYILSLSIYYSHV